MLVENVMSTGVVSVDINDGVVDIARKMQEENVGFVGIAENGRLCGVITDRDIVTKVLTNRTLKAADYMSKNIVSIEKNETVDAALKKMGEHRIKRLIVTENGNPVGVLSISDILTHGSSPLVMETFNKIYTVDKRDR